MKLTRRTALQAATALAACGPGFSDAGGVFPLDVSSGDVTPSGALLWTRYTGGRALTLEVWREDTGAVVVRAAPTPKPGGFTHFDAAGLDPYTRYAFAFDDGEARSATGRFRTAPDAGARIPLTFGAVSCTKEGFGLEPLVQAARRSDLDAFLWLGDTIYADGAKDLEGFRDKWMRGIGHPAQRAIRRATSSICAWDDHELFNNWDLEQLPMLPNEEYYAGLQAFYEHQPVRPGAGKHLWRSLTWGATAEVFVLDCRGERKPSARQYVSVEQLAWLKQGLKESPAAFKLILNTVPISNFPGFFFESTADDRWQGYDAQRAEILSFIDDERIDGVLWVAGDFHLACVGRVSRTGPGSTAIEALVGPGGQSPNQSPTYPGAPQFDWSSGINNYTAIALDPATGIATLSWIDGRGRVLTQRSYSL